MLCAGPRWWWYLASRGHTNARHELGMSYAEARHVLGTRQAPISCHCCGTVSDVEMCVCRSRDAQGSRVVLGLHHVNDVRVMWGLRRGYC